MWAKHVCPTWLYQPSLKIGVFIAVCCMPSQRLYSREYLEIVLQRKATLRDCCTHFLRLTESLVYKLQVGRDPSIVDFHFSDRGDPGGFMRLVESEEPALFGTFHVGHSDLLGCMLANFGRKIRMVRERVGNAYDLEMLERIFGDSVEFVWINEGESMLFALKSVADDGVSLALQCDREEHGSRHKVFDFLGARRRFPVTIYHLAFLFNMPVAFSFAVPLQNGQTEVVCSEVFVPQGDHKRDVLEAGYKHFQGVLTMLEAVLYQHPYAWFNFLPLNSEAADDVA
jgi:predicted LPLAT superfamily acyltransferase